MVPDCGSLVVGIEVQGRMPTSVRPQEKEFSAIDEAAKTADSSQPLFPTPLSSLTIGR